MRQQMALVANPPQPTSPHPGASPHTGCSISQLSGILQPYPTALPKKTQAAFLMDAEWDGHEMTQVGGPVSLSTSRSDLYSGRGGEATFGQHFWEARAEFELPAPAAAGKRSSAHSYCVSMELLHLNGLQGPLAWHTSHR